MSANVKIEGLKELQAKLNKYSEQKKRQVDTELQTTALEIETGAKKRCPVDTGRLRSSIHHRGRDLDYEILTDVHYGKYIEYGTSKMGAKPYMFPAFEFAKPGLMQRISEILGRPD